MSDRERVREEIELESYRERERERERRERGEREGERERERRGREKEREREHRLTNCHEFVNVRYKANLIRKWSFSNNVYIVTPKLQLWRKRRAIHNPALEAFSGLLPAGCIKRRNSG